MSDKKAENMQNGRKSISSEAFEGLFDNCFADSIELNSVDWGAVARSYKILRLRASDAKTFERNEKLLDDYNRWVAKRIN